MGRDGSVNVTESRIKLMKQLSQISIGNKGLIKDMIKSPEKPRTMRKVKTYNNMAGTDLLELASSK